MIYKEDMKLKIFDKVAVSIRIQSSDGLMASNLSINNSMCQPAITVGRSIPEICTL